MSIKSTRELEQELELARDYGILSPKQWTRFSNETIEERKALITLRRRVLESESNSNQRRQTRFEP